MFENVADIRRHQLRLNETRSKLAATEANLVRVEKRAQQRIYYVNPEPMKELEKWIKQFAASVEDQFQRLDKVLEKMSVPPAAAGGPTLHT